MYTNINVKYSKLYIEGLEPEGCKWLLTNFTGETKLNFDHTSITDY